MKKISESLRRKLVHRKPVFVVLFFLMFLILFFAHESSAGHNNSSLSGTYVMHIFCSGFHGGDPGAWGVNDQLTLEKVEFVFDGAGNFTSSFTEDQINRELLDTPVDWDPGAETDWVLQNTYNTTHSTESDTSSGTYSVASDGTVTITFDDGSGTAMLSSDGNTIVFSEVEFENSNQYGSMGFGVGVKQGSGFDNSSLSGTYVMHIFCSGFHGGDAGAWGVNDQLSLEKIEFVFDGAGNFTSSFTEDQMNRELLDTPVDWDPGAETDWVLQNTYNTTHSTESDTSSGTYSVASDGTVTIYFSDGTGTGMLSSDGNTIVFSEVEFENSNQYGSMGFGVGVKQGSGFDNSSLSGTYVMHDFFSGFHGGDPGAWGVNDQLLLEKAEFVFDGAGNFTSSFTEDQMNRQLLDTPVEYIPGDWVLQNTYNTTHSTESDTSSGTYSVASDGTVTITFDDGSGTAMLSSDGNTVVFSEAEFEDSNRWGSMGFGVGVKQVKGPGDELAADFDGNGLWHYSGSSWTHLAAWNPFGMEEWAGGLAVDFHTHGLWNYDGSSWTNLAAWNPSRMAEWAGGLSVGFETHGLWNYDGSSWTHLAAWRPYGMEEWAGGLAVDFWTHGLWNYDGSSWTYLAAWNPTTMEEWAGGLSVGFESHGLWNYDGSSWTNLAAWNPITMEEWAGGLAVDFATHGLWNYDGSSWSHLAAWDPGYMEAYGTGLAITFGSNGLWNYNGSSWTNLAAWNPTTMEEWAGGLAVDFATHGLWNYNGSSWSHLAAWNPEDIIDIDLY